MGKAQEAGKLSDEETEQIWKAEIEDVYKRQILFHVSVYRCTGMRTPNSSTGSAENVRV